MFQIGGVPTTLFGTLSLGLADNHAASLLGGFKEGFRAFRPCCHCMATQEELTTHFKESDFELRTPEMYDDQCSLVEGNSHGTHSREYGINRCSILNQLRHFNVVSGALVPDVMHDLLEGVLQYEVKLQLAQFILEDCYFTLEQLNHRIVSFELGYSELEIDRHKSPPQLSSNDNYLKQSGTHICAHACVLCI